VGEALADGRWIDGQVKDYAGERTQPAYWNNPPVCRCGFRFKRLPRIKKYTIRLAFGIVRRLQS
jgi:hypothetical protein